MVGMGKGLSAPMQKLEAIDCFGLKVMSIGFLTDPDQPIIWRGPMLHGVIKQFLTDVDWGELDYLVIDMPPGRATPSFRSRNSSRSRADYRHHAAARGAGRWRQGRQHGS